MELPPVPGARHLAGQRARGTRLLFGASAPGRACFNAYLRRFKKRDEEMCCYCDSSVDRGRRQEKEFCRIVLLPGS